MTFWVLIVCTMFGCLFAYIWGESVTCRKFHRHRWALNNKDRITMFSYWVAWFGCSFLTIAIVAMVAPEYFTLVLAFIKELFAQWFWFL